MQGRGLLKVFIDLPAGSKDNTVGNNLYTFPDATTDACTVITKFYQFSITSNNPSVTTTLTLSNITEPKTITTTTTYTVDRDTEQVKIIL